MKKAKKILVVEDEPTLVKAIETKLVKLGFEVVTAANGEEGLRQARSENPDLILLDIIMPVMDGLTMLKELRKTSDVPVIILSNLSSDEKLSEALRSGSHDYLIKTNYSLEEVAEKINKVLAE
ncbi:MAG: response regulator [Patescibacteria group bacterium]